MQIQSDQPRTTPDQRDRVQPASKSAQDFSEVMARRAKPQRDVGQERGEPAKPELPVCAPVEFAAARATNEIGIDAVVERVVRAVAVRVDGGPPTVRLALEIAGSPAELTVERVEGKLHVRFDVTAADAPLLHRVGEQIDAVFAQKAIDAAPVAVATTHEALGQDPRDRRRSPVVQPPECVATPRSRARQVKRVRGARGLVI